MQPEKIILLRHGQSILNVDKSVVKDTPDYACDLTELGQQQAITAGVVINDITQGQPIYAYYSPYWRTRSTFLAAAKGCNITHAREDVRLREQEWNTTFGEALPDTDSERDSYGHAYYRINRGEACTDGYDRVSDFISTLQRDFDKEKYPPYCLIVGHGMINRIFLWRSLQWKVEEFEIKANPHNCGIFELELQKDGKYKLITQLREYDKHNHSFQYPRLEELKQFNSRL